MLFLLLIAISPVLVAPIGAALVILLADRKDRNRAFVSIIQEREAMVCAIEEAGAEMRASGVLAEWYAMCDERVRRVSATVNGALLAELLRLKTS